MTHVDKNGRHYPVVDVDCHESCVVSVAQLLVEFVPKRMFHVIVINKSNRLVPHFKCIKLDQLTDASTTKEPMKSPVEL